MGIGTIANMVCVGYIADFGVYIWNHLIPESAWSYLLIRYVLLVPAMIVFVVGAALYMSVDLGMAPYDGIPFLIQRKQTRFSFRTVRMTWDLTFLLLGFVLGGTVGIVTLLQMLCLGPVIEWLKRKMSRHLAAA